MNRVDRVRAGACSSRHQLPEETLIDDHRRPKQDTTHEVGTKRSQNSMICEEGNVETVKPGRCADEYADPNLLSLWAVEYSWARRAWCRW